MSRGTSRRITSAHAALLALGAGLFPAAAQVIEPDTSAIEARQGQTLQDLAALGYKRTGTPEGHAAGDYVAQRFLAAGLANVRFEPFTIPKFDVQSSSLAVTVDGSPLPMLHDVFAYSGAGHADAEVVYVRSGRPPDYLGVDVAGKVVMVDRDTTYHRSSQYREIVAHGGIAMLYRSTSPQNLIQIGTVSDPEDGLGPIPAVTVGNDDGQAVVDAWRAGSLVRAVIDVAATVTPATGRNVVGLLPGSDPSGAYLLVGAHYDTWQIGSIDNGTGVAALLEIAEQSVAAGPGRFGLVFVGFDGEEQGLFGGYDYLRDHVVVRREPMLAFVNLEIPGSGPNDVRALARTEEGPIDETLDLVRIGELYNPVVDLALVPLVFGGIIPTDIQGMYWYGLQGLSTACDTPWYHTVEDTPDKVDLPFLARASLRMQRELEELQEEPIPAFLVRDDTLWRIVMKRRAVPDATRITVDVFDAAGLPVAGANVDLWVDVDDFFRVFRQKAVTDASGRTVVVVPTSATSQGSGARFVHVTAGQSYPLAETMAPILPPVGQ